MIQISCALRNRKEMKMLTKEGTQIDLSFGVVLELMKGEPRQSGEFLHHQICKELDGYHCIYTFPTPQTYPVYLKIILQPSPELLYGMMLLPYGENLACS